MAEKETSHGKQCITSYVPLKLQQGGLAKKLRKWVSGERGPQNHGIHPKNQVKKKLTNVNKGNLGICRVKGDIGFH